MKFISGPLPRTSSSGYFEGSSLPQVSVRDGRQVSKQWIKNRQDSENLQALSANVADLNNQVNRLRRRILGGNGAAFSLFTVFADGGDFMWCYMNQQATDVGFVPAATGTLFQVYKPWKLRISLATENINGVDFAYTYATNGDIPIPPPPTGPTPPDGTSFYTRNWTGSDGSSGSDYVIPFYLLNDPVWAVQDSASNWVDTNRDGRAWATFQQSP